MSGPPAPPASPAPAPHGAVGEARLLAYLEHLLAGDRDACRATVLELLDGGLPIPRLYVELFERSLHEVGRRWELGYIPVSTEHLATALTEELLSLVYPRVLDLPRNGRTALVSCASNELHQVGGRIVADTLELHGWSATFLGAGGGLARLESALRLARPDLAAFSLAMHDNLASLLEAIAAVRRAWPAVPVVAGGQAFLGGDLGLPERAPGVRVLGSLAELEAVVDAWPE